MSSLILLLALPFIIPLIGSVVLLFFSRQEWLKPLFLILHLAASAWLAVEVVRSGAVATTAGNWAAPYGIVLIADPFAAFMLLFSSFIFICCLSFWKPVQKLLSPLFFLLQAGVSLSFVSGDLFNLFVAFEIMLLSSYAIVASAGEKKALGNVYSYLSMNILASFIFLIGVAFFYGAIGSLNFGFLARQFQEDQIGSAILPLFVISVALIIKSGIFPLYFWLADSYPILPSRIAALFSGILSKVGIYVFYRLFLTVFPRLFAEVGGLFLILACLTMILGVVGAVSKNTVKGILSYHILSQVGYMLFALALSTTMAIAAGIWFVLHNMVVKSSLFLIGGIAEEKCGTDNLKKMGRLWASSPFLGALFLLQGFSLAGIPPLSGFWGKYLIFFEGMSTEVYFAVAVAVATSFLTLFSMIKIWNSAFWEENEPSASASVKKSAYAGPAALTITALCMGLFAESAYRFADLAAEKLVHNEEYIFLSLESGAKGESH